MRKRRWCSLLLTSQDEWSDVGGEVGCHLKEANECAWAKKSLHLWQLFSDLVYPLPWVWCPRLVALLLEPEQAVHTVHVVLADGDQQGVLKKKKEKTVRPNQTRAQKEGGGGREEKVVGPNQQGWGRRRRGGGERGVQLKFVKGGVVLLLLLGGYSAKMHTFFWHNSCISSTISISQLVQGIFL